MKKMKKGKAVAEASAMSEILPDDIMFNILSRLPEKSISRFRCVSKPWGHLFGSPNFIKLHIDHGLKENKCKLMLIEDNIMYTSIDYCDPSLRCCDITLIDYPFKEKENSSIGVQIVGSCNGLLCIIPTPNGDEERICLWNPFTKEYKKLSIPEDQILSDLDVEHVCITYGFGYDCNIEDYKLVRIQTFSDEEAPLGCEVHVYTLLSNTWKRIPDTYPYEICSWGVLVNGTLHWDAACWISGSIASEIIVSFDFGVERFAEILLPENLDDSMPLVVGELGRSLCIFWKNIDDDSFVVWQMKEYGVRESWTKLFSIVQQSLEKPSYQLIQSFKIGVFLLYIEWRGICVGRKHALVFYNPENEGVRPLMIRGGDWSDATISSWSDAKTYVESLVSLNTGTYLVQE